MSVPIIGFFNNKGGVGKTSLVYHLAWMFAELGNRVLAADLDPQSNLTAAFLTEERLESLWPPNGHEETVYGFIKPLLDGTGDISETPYIEIIENQDKIGLLAGDLALSGFEDELSEQWSKCLDGKTRAFRVISAFWRIIQRAANIHNADIVLMDLGPNLGAINRAALIAADYLIVPLSPDLFSIQGLTNLGPTVIHWRDEWKERIKKNPVEELELPSGAMQPIGYVILQYSQRLDRPVKAYERWVEKIPRTYQQKVLADNKLFVRRPDPQCLATIKHYRSLMPLAQEAHKPMFLLKPADGAIGAHLQAVADVYSDFKNLALTIFARIESPGGK